MNMTKEKDWADARADAVVNSIRYAQDPEAAIAVALQQVADECIGIAAERIEQGILMEPRYGRSALDVANAIRARFPRCHDGE